MPITPVDQNWGKILAGEGGAQLENHLLPAFLKARRWFGGKARRFRTLEIIETIPLGEMDSLVQILLIQITYAEGNPEVYVLPLAYAEESESGRIAAEFPDAIIAHYEDADRRGILYDGVYSDIFCNDLLKCIAGNGTISGQAGRLLAYRGSAYGKSMSGWDSRLKASVLKAEQSNTSIVFGEELFFKLYRHVEEGVNPDLEITRYLTEVAAFTHIPTFAGGLEYRRADGETMSLGILQERVPNQGDSWSYFLRTVRDYYQRVLERGVERREISLNPKLSAAISKQWSPSWAEDLMAEEPVRLMRLLGQRTAELHNALAAATGDVAFIPEPFTLSFQQWISQSMVKLVKQVLGLLDDNLPQLPQAAQPIARDVLGGGPDIVNRIREFGAKEMAAMRIRIHGDYHLGQVLVNANDFTIIDFEGEPARSLAERRMKHSALKDVAGMLRSIQYAAYISLYHEPTLESAEKAELVLWADFWCRQMGTVFLAAYLDNVRNSTGIPGDASQQEVMLTTFLLEKAVYELGYELNNRPEWVLIPLRGIKHLLMKE